MLSGWEVSLSFHLGEVYLTVSVRVAAADAASTLHSSANKTIEEELAQLQQARAAENEIFVTPSTTNSALDWHELVGSREGECKPWWFGKPNNICMFSYRSKRNVFSSLIRLSH